MSSLFTTLLATICLLLVITDYNKRSQVGNLEYKRSEASTQLTRLENDNRALKNELARLSVPKPAAPTWFEQRLQERPTSLDHP